MATYTFPTTAAPRTFRGTAALCMHTDLRDRNAVTDAAMGAVSAKPSIAAVPAFDGTEQGRPPRGVPR